MFVDVFSAAEAIEAGDITTEKRKLLISEIEFYNLVHQYSEKRIDELKTNGALLGTQEEYLESLVSILTATDSPSSQTAELMKQILQLFIAFIPTPPENEESDDIEEERARVQIRLANLGLIQAAGLFYFLTTAFS